MVAERAWWLAGALCACSAAAAEPATLSVSSPAASTLRAGELHRHPLQLGERECAFASLQPSAAELQLRVLRAGDKTVLRTLHVASGRGAKLDFCVDAAGAYLLELRASSAGAYRLALDAVLPRPLLPQPSAADPESPRLRAQLAAGADTRAFWANLRTPLVEPRAADSALVTFVYRAAPNTRRVSVGWPAWTDAFSDNSMSRLGETDILWKSIVLPRATRMSYQLVVDPPLSANSDHPLAERAQDAVARPDPRNPKRDGERSLLELPDAPPERWLKGSAPAGRLERQSLASRALGNEHALSVYLPPGYKREHAPYPLAIVFDGESYLERVHMPALLDHMIAARAMPALVAVFVHNASADSRERELPCNAAFAEFVATELLPFIRAHYPVAPQPGQVALVGSSFGGLASSYIALLHPELFGLVLSQSGSYWWAGAEQPGWLRRRYRERPRTEIRFYMSAGEFEGDPSGNGVLDQTRLEVSALRDLGYSVAYQEFSGGHDFSAWRATLPDGLRALFAP